MSKEKTALVTGGAGFIGSHLVDRLVKGGYKVRVIDNLCTGNLDNIRSHLSQDQVSFVEGDIRDFASVEKCVNEADIVVHLAALTSVPFSVQQPDLTFDVNVWGSINLLQACIKAGVGRVVFASSSAVYGEPEFLPLTEKAQVKPISPYADSKLAVERCLRGFSNRGVLESVALRFFNVYGPRQGLSEYSGVIRLFMERCSSGLPLLVYGDGLQTRDFVSVHDVVEAILSSMECTGIEGEVINIGSGKVTTINELARAVLELSGKDLVVQHQEPRKGDIKDSYADVSKAKLMLGFDPKVTLREGLKELINH